MAEAVTAPVMESGTERTRTPDDEAVAGPNGSYTRMVGPRMARVLEEDGVEELTEAVHAQIWRPMRSI